MESLRDTISTGQALPEALPASALTAAPEIAEPLANLLDRMRARQSLDQALLLLADDLDGLPWLAAVPGHHTRLEAWHAHPDRAHAALCRHFGVEALDELVPPADLELAWNAYVADSYAVRDAIADDPGLALDPNAQEFANVNAQADDLGLGKPCYAGPTG